MTNLSSRAHNLIVAIFIVMFVDIGALDLVPTAGAQTPNVEQLAALKGAGSETSLAGGFTSRNISVAATVETTESLEVRSAADTAASIFSAQTPFSKGTVVGGPTIAGSAFFQDFSQSLDTSMFTEGHGRMEVDTILQSSTVAVSGGRLLIKAGEQNYGDSAVRVNQAFDFANRTGTITFDVNTNQADGWTAIALSELPYPYISFASDNTFGPFPQEGILIQYRSAFSCVSLRVYHQGAQTGDGYECGSRSVKNGPDILNHVVMQVSASQITVTTDGDKLTFPVSLGFTRGYLYLISHNHATMKYANKPTWDTQWDNLSFDGPVIPAIGVALSPFSLPANPSNPRLVLMAQHSLENRDVSLAYRLNSGPAHDIPLVRRSDQVGVYMISQAIDANELRDGANTVTFEQTGMDRPSFTNVQLVWNGAGTTAPPAPDPITASTPRPPTPAPVAPISVTPPASTQSRLAFSEDFSTETAFAQRFDHGWSGEWNAGKMFGNHVNDWHADHGMTCGDPNTTNRTIHLTSQQQANDAAFFYCMPNNDPTKGHLMTTVNTAGYVTAWFSPRQTFRNVSKVCWDQNLTDLGGGKWTIVNFLMPAEYAGKTDLGYTSVDFPNNGGPSSPQGAAQNGVRIFRGGMNTYTNGRFHGGASGTTVSDKVARFQHCVIDNGNGTLTTTIAQPNGGTVSSTVTGNIPDGDIRVEFADDSYNPDKHFDANGVPMNSSGLYTWHWDNIQIYTR
jgi:hypothetical protein